MATDLSRGWLSDNYGVLITTNADLVSSDAAYMDVKTQANTGADEGPAR